MKEIPLRPYQREAVKAVQAALEHGKKRIVVEMSTGSGKGLVLAKTVDVLNGFKSGKILVIIGRREQKEQVEHLLFEHITDFDKANIEVEIQKNILTKADKYINQYEYFIFDDAPLSEQFYERLICKEKTMIVFSTEVASYKLFQPDDVVFSYSYEDAVYDGIITPAMDWRAAELATEAFGKQLLEQFGYMVEVPQSNIQNIAWDLVAQNSKGKIWVECKRYKSQVVSPSAADSLLKTILMRKMKQDISHNDIVLLMVFSKIPSFQKDEIYDRYGIVVWDIENLVFYSKNNSDLLKRLSQITYFPIDYVEGRSSKEAKTAGLSLTTSKDEIIQDAEKEANETGKLIQRLEDCKTGKKYSGEYEAICEAIIRTLFEASYFNRLTSQHKTRDAHFRMDLIGALKINQSNEESMHPLWQMLVQHYNSHFVVFEFKNYSEKIDQNLIYITEKYLFDAALRNVAIIISRKGFSKSAEFAVKGCLKEHGKLIIDITDKDLIDMIELKSDEAADLLLRKLEEFLMSISK